MRRVPFLRSPSALLISLVVLSLYSSPTAVAVPLEPRTDEIRLDQSEGWSAVLPEVVELAGAVRSYTNPLGVNAPAITDTGAFPEEP